MKKRFLCLILSVLLVLETVPVYALTQTNQEDSNGEEISMPESSIKEIIEFEELSYEDMQKNIPIGTPFEEIDFPKELVCSVLNDAVEPSQEPSESARA